MRLSAPIFRLKRQARLLAREAGLPLHAALDRLAQDEGFRSWSHLAARFSERSTAGAILAQLNPGDVILLGARPGQGKTLLGLALAVEAVRAGRRGFFFTLDWSEGDVLHHLRSIGTDPETLEGAFVLDTSDDIRADRIEARLSGVPRGTLAVVDYLQLLDQRRCNPELGDQMAVLSAFARASGVILVMISQIDRRFDLQAKPLPDLADVRLPNPLDLGLFTKTCFLHEGALRLEAPA
ncbi:MAG TPA: DNA helicase [Kiloniellaceae bacterium]|nr:DNA helicase [Kiloniellaceae bacterium]HIP77329.1 DNA helicase [Kiloniellaceae bacterium]